MELVHQDPRDLEYHEQGHEQVVHEHVEHEQHVEYETHEYQTVSQSDHPQGGEHDPQGHYEQKYQTQDEYEEKYDVAKYDQQTELVDTYPRYLTQTHFQPNSISKTNAFPTLIHFQPRPIFGQSQILSPLRSSL